MSLIVRDPTLKNVPSGFASFCTLAKAGHPAEEMGFRGKYGDISRFAVRFRVAKSFKGIALDGYSPDTIRGYNALFRVFLVWSAFERFMEILGEKPDTIIHRVRPYAPAKNLQAILKHDRNGLFLSFLMQHVNRKMKEELQSIQDGKSKNVTALAAAARHIFAHGHLSAHANNANPKDVDAICVILFQFHLNVMDQEFGKMIKKYKNSLRSK